MPTTKTRTNITLDAEQDLLLTKLAKRDGVPKATKAAELLKLAISIDEDDCLDEIAKSRDTKAAKFLSHEDAWA